MAVEDLIILADARLAVGMRGTAGTDRNADLERTYIPAVTPIVEDIHGGPIVRRPFTHVDDGGSFAVLLPHLPHTVTSVTADGTLLAPTDYTVDAEAGVIYYGTTVPATGTFAGGRGAVTVVYTAGVCDDTTSVPPNLKLAARLVLADQWQSDQQGNRPDTGDGTTDRVTTPSGYDVPARAYALARPGAADLPGFA